jgi:hypothetical protein
MIYGYPQPGKEKSRVLLQAFVAGAGGELRDPLEGWRSEAGAAFYGTVGIERVFRQARAAAGDRFCYLDNAFLDAARETHYRVGTWGRLQGPLIEEPDYKRLGKLGVVPASWTRSGRHILICPQSDYFMRELADYRGGTEAWIEDCMRRLTSHTDRPIRVREWSPNKIALAKTLHKDLEGCWAVVVHSSAAAIAAILAGVPAFITSRDTPMLEMGSCELSEIERPRRPDGRAEGAARLAAAQWPNEERRDGTAWNALGPVEETA